MAALSRPLNRRRTWRSMLIAATALGWSTQAAIAQDAADATRLGGAWKFETGDFGDNCHIEGDITLRPSALPGAYSCTFESEQICQIPGQDEPHRYIRVAQSCTAQRIGDGVTILSQVEDILEYKAVDGIGGYYADNFVLRVTKKGAEMVGTQYDEVRKITARFWRDLELNS